MDELEYMPSMMGLDDEMIFPYVYGKNENGGFTTHYTALLNDKRVWVFPLSESYMVQVTPPNVCNHDQFRAYAPVHRDVYVARSVDPLTFLAVLHKLTSEGK